MACDGVMEPTLVGTPDGEKEDKVWSEGDRENVWDGPAEPIEGTIDTDGAAHFDSFTP